MKDPYVYEGTNVLINKANIQDKDKYEEFENRMVNLSLIKLLNDNFVIQNANDVLKIHKAIFDSVYNWAGKQRTINIYKNEPILGGISVEYSDYYKIGKDLKTVNLEFQKYDWKVLSEKDFIFIFTRILARIWKIHPFREGNTRTISTFAYLFLKQYGYKFNTKFIEEHAKYFRNALVMASLGDYAEYNYLQNILIDSISVTLSKESEVKYKKIKDYDVDKYEHAYHEQKK